MRPGVAAESIPPDELTRSSSSCPCQTPETITMATQLSARKRESAGGPNPILVPSRSPSPQPPCRRSSKHSRQRLYSVIELSGFRIGSAPREIASADDLGEPELQRLFQILHACGVATDSGATLKTTRDSMEGFLDAVFNNWSSASMEDLEKPAIDFVVREFSAVGHLCNDTKKHADEKACVQSFECTSSTVYAVMTYHAGPSRLEIGLTLDEPSPAAEPELLCPFEGRNVRWRTGAWLAEARGELKRSCLAKVHRHNKHLAVWRARNLVRGWAAGGGSMGDDGAVLSFADRDAVYGPFMALGG